MKICICSSFKFYKNVQDLALSLKNTGFEVLLPIPNPFFGWKKNDNDELPKEVLEAYWKHLTDHLKRINAADIVYIYTENEYIGNGVSLEIGYAYSKNKKIISSDNINDLPISCFVDEIVTPENFIGYLQKKNK